MRQIILDTETTGLEPSQGHRIIEIAAVEMVNRKLSPPDRHFHCYINPERDSDEGALQVHGLTREFLADKPKFADIAPGFLDYVRGAELIIHNAPFDIGFLNSEFERLGLGDIRGQVSGVIDTLKMAKDQFPGKRNNLDVLCDRFFIDRSARTLHGALIDCELLSDVYLAMTRGQDSLMIDLVLPRGANDESGALRVRPPIKPVIIDESERALHEQYLDTLDSLVKGRCLWRQPAAESS